MFVTVSITTGLNPAPTAWAMPTIGPQLSTVSLTTGDEGHHLSAGSGVGIGIGGLLGVIVFILVGMSIRRFCIRKLGVPANRINVERPSYVMNDYGRNE